MTHKNKKRSPDDPKPLNFDDALEKGPSDRLKKPFMTPSEVRVDNRDDQYYEMEEAISPEEVRQRKKEEDLP